MGSIQGTTACCQRVSRQRKKERVQILRKAFLEMVKDKDILRDAAKAI
jgi:hypothetical protein